MHYRLRNDSGDYPPMTFDMRIGNQSSVAGFATNYMCESCEVLMKYTHDHHAIRLSATNFVDARVTPRTPHARGVQSVRRYYVVYRLNAISPRTCALKTVGFQAVLNFCTQRPSASHMMGASNTFSRSFLSTVATSNTMVLAGITAQHDSPMALLT